MLLFLSNCFCISSASLTLGVLAIFLGYLANEKYNLLNILIIIAVNVKKQNIAFFNRKEA